MARRKAGLAPLPRLRLRKPSLFRSWLHGRDLLYLFRSNRGTFDKYQWLC